jgi:hypothetical protein
MNQDSAALLNAIRGPVVMITVGVLFALDNFTPFSFNRTWPLLLVVVGILSLGKRRGPLHGRMRYQAKWGPPRPPVPPPPPATGTASGPVWGAPTGASAAGPGTYRGSSYEATPGGATRGSETRGSETRPGGTGARQ